MIPPPPLSLSATKPIAVDRNRNKGLTMSRGNVGGKSVARMDAFTWLSSVKVGGRRGDKEGSSGATSGVESAGNNSTVNSRVNSRVPSEMDLTTHVRSQTAPILQQQQQRAWGGGGGDVDQIGGNEGQIERRNLSQDAMRRLPSPSRSRTADDKKEGEGQLLQEE